MSEHIAHQLARIAAAEERQAKALEYRVRLAAITAHTKGITLPTDLAALAEEDPS